MSSSARIRYRIIASNPEAHRFTVECRVGDPEPSGQRFSLPAWIPGSYMIRDFARHIIQLHARCDGEPVDCRKLDKQTWQCAPCRGELLLEYEVYAWDLSVRAAHLDQTHAYFNGSSVFLVAEGRQQLECELQIEPPPRDYAENWKVATALERLDAAEHGFGRYLARDYDELIDTPVEIGDLTLMAFDACGTPHELAIYGRLPAGADIDRLTGDLTDICEHHIRFFGEPAPMSRYVFLLMVIGDGYGGLEHRASSSNMCKRDDLPRQGETAVSDGYRTLLGLLSHEYFHSWNVKRIKPARFQPYDLSRESYTSLMWVFEGITSYYDDLALLRCDLIDQASYLELLGRTITRVWRGGGRFKQTVLESSFDAWTKFYKQDENAPNAIVSYYTKGSLIALCLDLLLRQNRDNRVSLDQIMRVLWERHGQTGEGLPENGMETLCETVSGINLAAFFEQALRTTEDLPIADLLEQAGFALRWRGATGPQDKGGTRGEDEPRCWLGANVGGTGPGARLTQVIDHGPAQLAGLSAGDEVIALDGLRVNAAELVTHCARMSPGQTARIDAFRRDELMGFELIAQLAPATTAYIEPLTEPRPGDWPEAISNTKPVQG